MNHSGGIPINDNGKYILPDKNKPRRAKPAGPIYQQ